MDEENIPPVASESDKPKGVSLKVDDEVQRKSRVAKLRGLVASFRRKDTNGAHTEDKQEVQIAAEEDPEISTKTSSSSPNAEVAGEVAVSVENDEIVKGKQVLAEIVETVRDWEAFKANASVSEEFGVVLEGLNLQQLFIRERQLEQEIGGFTNSLENIPFDISQQRSMIYPSAEIIKFAQKNLAAKKQLNEDFAKINSINGKTKAEALKYAEVDSEEELADLREQYPSSYDDLNMKPEDADVAWDAVKDALKKDDPRLQDKDFVIEGFQPIWHAEGLVDYIKREEILQKIYEGAKASGNEDLARRMRAQIIYSASISLSGSRDTDRDLKYQRDWFEQKSREELLASAYYLANFMDKTEGGNDNLQNAATKLGVDAESLGAAFDDRSADFYGKAITGDLKIPLDQYPDYFKRLLARSVDGRSLANFAQDFPMEKITTSEYFRGIGDFFASDTTISETAGEKIKAFKLLGNSQVLASKIREGHYNYETLIGRIVKQDDWEKVGARFEKVAKVGSESDLVWEYFRLIAKEKGSNMMLNIPASKKDIPGLPDRLQWKNLSKADRQRLVVGDVDSELFEPENLTEVGRLVMTKAILEEVLTRSQDKQVKETADKRNRELVAGANGVLEEGDLLHGTNVANIGAVLYSGHRAGEFLGFDESQDLTPFAADFSRVLATEVSGEFDYDDPAALKYLDVVALRKFYEQSPFRAIYYASIASQYGAREVESFTSRDAKSDSNTGVTLIFKRGREDAFLKGTENQGHMREHHTLVYVGLPATEISGMIVSKESQKTIEATKAEIVKNGFYVPIYDLDGELMFTSQEYDAETGK